MKKLRLSSSVAYSHSGRASVVAPTPSIFRRATLAVPQMGETEVGDRTPACLQDLRHRVGRGTHARPSGSWVPAASAVRKEKGDQRRPLLVSTQSLAGNRINSGSSPRVVKYHGNSASGGCACGGEGWGGGNGNASPDGRGEPDTTTNRSEEFAFAPPRRRVRERLPGITACAAWAVPRCGG
jgi:hypothetical protein